MNTLRLKKGEERRLKAGHLWVYTNEVDVQATPFSRLEPGQLVRVEDFRRRPLGVAAFSQGSLICARLLDRNGQAEIDEAWFVKRLESALRLREAHYREPFYRWVYADSDGLPGLVVDRMDDVCVVQANTQGMDLRLSDILSAIRRVVAPRAIVVRNDSPARELEGLELKAWIEGEPSAAVARLLENGVAFDAHLLDGQKTGWFYDHRDARRWLEPLVEGKKVLDVFSYAGAFSVPAAVWGAESVIAIDASEKALSWLKHNATLNQVEQRVATIKGDAFEELRKLHQDKTAFDVVVVDPPAFIKRKKDLRAGMEAYQRINGLAMGLLKPQGLLLAGSCSMQLSMDDFRQCLRKALITAGRQGRILREGFQPPDHPVHPAIPETRYLKSILMQID